MVERENTKQEEEFRKIKYSGKSSFTIALPKKWVTNQKLNAGDQLSVRSDNSNNLVLSTNKNSKEKIYKSIRNIPNVKITDVNHFSAFDLVKYNKLIFTESSIKELEKRYS